jgi:hypothetical protein
MLPLSSARAPETVWLHLPVALCPYYQKPHSNDTFILLQQNLKFPHYCCQGLHFSMSLSNLIILPSRSHSLFLCAYVSNILYIRSKNNNTIINNNICANVNSKCAAGFVYENNWLDSCPLLWRAVTSAYHVTPPTFRHTLTSLHANGIHYPSLRLQHTRRRAGNSAIIQS